MKISSPFFSNFIPSRLKELGIIPRFSYETFLMVISEPVIAARPIKLPISIISGRILCSQPFNSLTPSMVNKFEPIPEILAPILTSILHNC